MGAVGLLPRLAIHDSFSALSRLGLQLRRAVVRVRDCPARRRETAPSHKHVAYTLMYHSGDLRTARIAHLKRRAAQQLQSGNFGRAADTYGEALSLLDEARTCDRRQRAELLSNRSAALLRAGAAASALNDAEAAAAAAPCWAKPQWRRGRAFASLSRWPDALAAYLAAWAAAEPGSHERGECEAAAAASLARMTAQQVADALLALLLGHERECEQSGGIGSCPAPQATPGAACIPAQAARGAGAGDDRRLAAALPLQLPLMRAAEGGELAWLEREEQREAARALVATPPPWSASAAPPLSRRGPALEARALLLRWLCAAAAAGTHGTWTAQRLPGTCACGLRAPEASSEGAAAPGGSAASALWLEVKLLSARLAVAGGRWDAARRAAAAAERGLAAVALQDEGRLLALALEAHAVHGDALMAGCAARGADGSKSGACRAADGTVCLPAEAAAAYLAATRLLTEAGGGAESAARRELSSKLSAAQALLSDAEHAALWAAARPEHAPAGPGAVAAAQAGLELTRLQLGAAAAAAAEPQLLATLRVVAEAVPALPGRERVALLSGLARVASVPRRSVSLVCAGAAADEGGGHLLSFKVLFGSDADGAAALLTLVESAGALAKAFPELPAALASGAAGGAAAPVWRATARLQDLRQCAGDGGGDIGLDEGADVDVGGHRSHGCAVDVGGCLDATDGADRSRPGAQLPASQITAAGSAGSTADAAAGGVVGAAEAHAGTAAAAASATATPARQPGERALVAAAHSGAGSVSAAPDAAAEAAAAAAAAAIEARLARLPYARYDMTAADGRPLERPRKHPFCMARVTRDAREAPAGASAVWYAPAHAPLRWRQSAGTVEVQLLNVPAWVTRGAQLVVTLQPYRLRVALQHSRGGGHSQGGGADVLLEAELERGIVPEESTWTLEPPCSSDARRSSGAGGEGALACTPLAAGALAAPAAAALAAVACSTPGEGRLLLSLAKLNLELFQTPWQHSASWWPRLFAGDAGSAVAWDDEAKDYSDLPAAVAAAADATDAADEATRRADAARQAARRPLADVLERHARVRCERLRQLRGAAWARSSAAAAAAR